MKKKKNNSGYVIAVSKIEIGNNDQLMRISWRKKKYHGIDMTDIWEEIGIPLLTLHKFWVAFEQSIRKKLVFSICVSL